jgi:hypothetical protein
MPSPDFPCLSVKHVNTSQASTRLGSPCVCVFIAAAALHGLLAAGEGACAFSCSVSTSLFSLLHPPASNRSVLALHASNALAAAAMFLTIAQRRHGNVSTGRMRLRSGGPGILILGMATPSAAHAPKPQKQYHKRFGRNAGRRGAHLRPRERIARAKKSSKF